ncbi:sugar transferase [Pseudaestuariivita atlantica]|uniref:Sugar transferase n=1 Tax=Pseudaestuariivita atlantica TaxID=1317121 RepID=A0A0L1JNL8_9RHOB|nr:sugar transferase [Pseudaestuariivita atlantica]KNG93354.1 sugar transferase [Pseudaestuariivita atlantica]
MARLATAPAAPLPGAKLYQSYIKRGIDIAIVLVAAVPVLFVLTILSAAIAMDGVNPFYRQKRLGKDGRVFSMWKLRSMVRNADALLEDYLCQNPDARREWDISQKLKFDPRITPIGRIIRKTSLDELPQLWNVLIGDMSLVGPRPMMVDQRTLYPGDAYYRMRPGITGLWQISDRNETSFAERAIYDTAYWRAQSLRTDIVVMIRTVGVVLRGTGY